MNEQEALAKMVAPGTRRPGKFREGVIQIHVTRACDKACLNCTQGSELAGRTHFMPPEMFAQAVESLRGYFGVVGVFGGNPAMSPFFVDYCAILRESWVPKEQRGLWCNNLLTWEKGAAARETFNPGVSNLNVHLDERAWDNFRLWWPEVMPFGRDRDSRHAPVFAAMRDVLRKPCPKCKGKGIYPHTSDFVGYGLADPPPKLGTMTLQHNCLECGGDEWNPGSGQVYDEARAWELISRCDINQHWSAMIGMFRGELRAWFCEIAGAQSILHQDEPDYPDTGFKVVDEKGEQRGIGNYFEENTSGRATLAWWEAPMSYFAHQVRKHCHECGIPLRGRGELSQAEGEAEQTTATHEAVFRPKRRDRRVKLVTIESQLGHHPRESVIKYVEPR